MKKQVFVTLAALFVFVALFAPGVHATDNVYALLYEDGMLVFQHGDTPDGHAVKETYEVDLTAVYATNSYAPWYNERESIRVVNFADKISPTATTYWFYQCENLERVDNIQNLDTSNVTRMFFMFSACSRLTALNVSHFDTANVTNMQSMFSNCSGLTELNVSSFDTSKVTSMASMFRNCGSLKTLDLSNFNTFHVMSMRGMFYNCPNLTALDISRFDTSNVTNMDYMFSGCSNLKAIYASDKFTSASVTDSDNMFSGCVSLVGDNGTKYDESHVDATYARIDTTETPGYFSSMYKITATGRDTFGNLSVTLINLDAVIMAVSYFDASGKFVSTNLQGVRANAETATSFVPANAKTARVMLFDSDYRPMCAPFAAVV